MYTLMTIDSAQRFWRHKNPTWKGRANQIGDRQKTVTFDTHSTIRLNHQIEKKVREAGSSFYWAMRLLDAEKRRAMYAVYAFCREVDDIADGQDPETKKLEELNKWRREIAQGLRG